MPAYRQCSRVDTMELKLQIVKNLGRKTAMKYFSVLERYLSLGINKTQFQNLCYSTIGRENAKLHNRLINAILGNAHLAHVAQTQHYRDTKLTCGSVEQFTKLLRGSLGEFLEAYPRKARSRLGRRPRDCRSSVELKRKVSSSVIVEEACKSKEKKTGTEVVSVGGKACSVNVGEAHVSQEKHNGCAGISLDSKSPCIAVQEACRSQEKLTGTEVISLGSNSPLINVQEACKTQEKQIGTEVITIGSKATSLNFHKVCKSPDCKAPSMNVRKACKPQEEQTMISINGKALTTNAQVVCELQEEQIGSEVISGGTKAPSMNVQEACQPEEKHISSIGIKAPSMNVQGACNPREMQIGPEVISLCNKAPSINAQEVCKSQEKQTGHQLMSIYREAPSVNAQEFCKFHEKQAGHELIPVAITAPALNVQEVCTFPQKQTSPEVQSIGSKLTAEVILVEDEDEVEQTRGSPYVQSRSPLMPPLGILKGVGGLPSRARSSATDFHLGSLMVSETCQSSGELPDTMSLMKRMEKKLEHEGLSLSPDCADLLNNALNAYMKRLIKPSVDLARSRHGKRRMLDLANARFHDIVAWQEACERSMNQSSASVLDFLVSMESSPKLLGVDWPVQLEKISVSSMEE